MKTEDLPSRVKIPVVFVGVFGLSRRPCCARRVSAVSNLPPSLMFSPRRNVSVRPDGIFDIY